MGFIKGNTYTKTRVRTAESAITFIDSRYKSSAFDMSEFESKINGAYHCGKTVSRNLEVVLKLSMVSKCHIKINAPSIVPIKKPCAVKPIPPQKYFCVNTARGCFRYKYNKLFHYIWKEIWSTCSKNFKRGFNNLMKTKYLIEMNRYRRFCGNPPLLISRKLIDLAQRCADSVANYRKSRKDITLKSLYNQYSKYRELIAYTSRGSSMFLIYVLFEDAWTHNSNFNRLSTKKWEMAQLMDKKTKYVGIGVSSSQNTVYVCIKFASDSMYAE
uniref:SCP domain-containing protein n=1 Tax=Strongyloides venezuelensis TaxID=75913 RepID=A0A0K0FIX9_STRVS